MQTVATHPGGVYFAPEIQSEPKAHNFTRVVAVIVSLVLTVSASIGGRYFWSTNLTYANTAEVPTIKTMPITAGEESRAKIAERIQQLEKEEQAAAEARRAQAATVSKTRRVSVPATPANSLEEAIAQWQAAHAGMIGNVYIREIGGQGRQAGSGANTTMFSASLYKLYVAHYLYNRVEQGTLTFEDTLGSSKTVGQCINAMIVVSDNDCPHAVANTVGWGTLDAFAKAQGFSGTVLAGGNIQTSPLDAANFLVRLQAGELMNAGHTAQLLAYMKQQIYRSAIPAGAAGSTVANKVGFYGGYWHDAGIVYGPSGTYVISVMTKGGSAKTIASLTAQVHGFLNR